MSNPYCKILDDYRELILKSVTLTSGVCSSNQMMPIALFKSISYRSQNQKASFKYAENTSKQIQPYDIDAIN